MNKLGSYITKLMKTVLDLEQEQFVRDLALSELRRLNVDLDIVDDIAVRKNFNKTLKANSFYNSWLQEYQNIIKKKINDGNVG